VALDVGQRDWPACTADAIFSANTFHIMSWAEVVMLLQRAAQLLPTAGVLAIYGPFQYAGQHTSVSNRQFDLMLQRPRSAFRHTGCIRGPARRTGRGLLLEADHAMPANNRVLVLRKAVRPGACLR